MPTVNQSGFWETSNKAFGFISGSWKHSSAAIVALAAFVGEVYIIFHAYEAGKAVYLETNDNHIGPKNHSYFFWLALVTVVACANNLVIAGLATFKTTYMRTNRENNTKWLWPLVAAFACMMGLTAGILPAALKVHKSPSAFAVVSILSIYFQSILWAIILGWRGDVGKSYKSEWPSPTPPPPPPPPPPVTNAAQPPTITPPRRRPHFFLYCRI